MNENVSILIAEDDVDINKLLYKILAKKGYNVRCTYSGSEAEMCIERYNFSLVLLDLMLPGITGEELIGKIRSKIAEADPDTEYIHTVWGIGFKMSE